MYGIAVNANGTEFCEVLASGGNHLLAASVGCGHCSSGGTAPQTAKLVVASTVSET